MVATNSPRWLHFLERRCPWLAVPNIGLLLVTLQCLGFFLIQSDPIWKERLALIPDRVFHASPSMNQGMNQVFDGEPWRLITFLAIPIFDSPIWLLFGLWFIYFILGEIEQQWGDFKTTFYLLVSIVLTILMSFLLNYPVTQVTDFTSTLFLAGAALFPEFEVRLFFIFPVKMKWLAGLTLLFLAIRFLQAPLFEKLYLLAIYSNYLLFFGPELVEKFRNFRRRRKFKRMF